MIINEVGAVWRKRASCDATKADDGGATRACCSPVPRAAATRARRCGCGGRRQASGGRARWALASQPAVRASGLPRQNLRRRSASAAGGPASLPGPTAGHTSDIVPVRALERVRGAGRRLDAGPQNDVASEVGRAGGARRWRVTTRKHYYTSQTAWTGGLRPRAGAGVDAHVRRPAASAGTRRTIASRRGRLQRARLVAAPAAPQRPARDGADGAQWPAVAGGQGGGRRSAVPGGGACGGQAGERGRGRQDCTARRQGERAGAQWSAPVYVSAIDGSAVERAAGRLRPRAAPNGWKVGPRGGTAGRAVAAGQFPSAARRRRAPHYCWAARGVAPVPPRASARFSAALSTVCAAMITRPPVPCDDALLMMGRRAAR